MKYDAVIFDLDGTLLNTLEDLADAVNYCMEKYGYSLRTLEEIRGFVGNGIGKLMERALPTDITEKEFDLVFDEFRTYYTGHCQEKTRAYDGIMELLTRLREDGFKMAIVSNKNMAAVQELNHLYFEEFIKIAIGEQDGVRKKPFPDSVYKAIEELHGTKERVLYVGDSEVDAETARQAGIPCVLVSWGFRDREVLESLGALRVIDTPQELLQIL